MPALQKKTKMISVRLSLEEYESLKTVYPSRGVRSVSELAREGMRQILIGAGPSPTLEHQVRSLNTKVNGLQSELTQLSRIVTESLKR
jgi:hypothetical protein